MYIEKIDFYHYFVFFVGALNCASARIGGKIDFIYHYFCIYH